MARMLGRQAWGGFCACCNLPRLKGVMRAKEKRRWRKEWAADVTQSADQ